MQKLGVVVFGASVYENHQDLNNSRFANSAKEFKNIVSDPTIISGCKTEILDLYDEPLLPSDTFLQITDFVSRDFDNIIIYYCGHGDVSPRGAFEYRVFLRRSIRDRRHATLLNIVGLIKDVERVSAHKKIFFILDACYSGSVISQMQEFMDAGGVDALVDRHLSESISQSGTAVFAATRGIDVALVKTEDKLSLFTGALVRCLKEGVVRRSDSSTLSWSDVRDEIIRITRQRLGAQAPVPRISSLDEKYGDVTRVPFFVNRAYVPRDTPEVDDDKSEYQHWKNISRNATPSDLEGFLTEFPAGMFAAIARDRLSERVDRFSEAELEGHLCDHPASLLKERMLGRRAKMKWDQIRKGTDVTELKHFISEFPDSEFADEARRKIEGLGKIKQYHVAAAVVFVALAVAGALILPKSKPVDFSTKVNYDIAGGDIAAIKDTDPVNCKFKCQTNNRCIAYSFDKLNRSCYLKDTLRVLTLDPRVDTNIRKDQQHPGLSPNNARFCRYPGAASGEGPAGFKSLSANACELSCQPDTSCVAYIFRANECKLLRTVDRQTNIPAVTGVRTQKPC